MLITFWVKCTDWLPVDIHEPCARGRAQIPKSDGVVQGARHEGVVNWTHLEGDHFFGVAGEVTDKLVIMQAQVSGTKEKIQITLCT